LLADTPFAPGRSISGFRTEVVGTGHVVLMVADFEAALAFYQDLLGFQISDYMRTPKVCFLHVNTRHHSLALFEHPRQGMHHLLVELYSLDNVGQGYDIARAQADRIKATGSRCHLADITTTT
jgi:catechol 2,3-dioxygenase-like lactoylglutathione lyase family enzyme